MAITTSDPADQDHTSAPTKELFTDDKKVYTSSTDGDDTSISSNTQVGVQAMEAISVSWTKWSLIAAYTS